MKRTKIGRLGRLLLLVCWLSSPGTAQEQPSTPAEHAHADGLASYRSGDRDAARSAFERAVELDYQFVAARYDLGILLLELGEADEGLRHFWLVANEIAPKDAEAHHRHALALNRAARADEAAAALRMAIRIDPQRLAARRDLITLLLANGDLMSASQLADEATRLHPDDGSVYNDHGVVMMRVGKPEEALASFKKAVVLNDLNPDAHYNLGQALNEQWKLEPAAQHLERALQLAPNYADAQFELGTVFARQGETERARATFDAVLASDPRAYRAHYELGMLAFRDRAFKQAFQHFNSALRQNPGHASSQLQLARALVALERPQLAVAQYRGALQQQPQQAQIHFELGAALQAAGDLEQASVHYQEALWLRPHWAAAQKALSGLKREPTTRAVVAGDAMSDE